MIVRALDINGDWQYGQSLNDYRSANAAVAQTIRTRLYSFLGDCFFDLGAGVNWFVFLSGKNELGLNLAVSSVILNTANVLSLTQLSIALTNQRVCTIQYTVQTTYSVTSNIVEIAI